VSFLDLSGAEIHSFLRRATHNSLNPNFWEPQELSPAVDSSRADPLILPQNQNRTLLILGRDGQTQNLTKWKLNLNI
jgi:hypothetical protein